MRDMMPESPKAERSPSPLVRFISAVSGVGILFFGVTILGFIQSEPNTYADNALMPAITGVTPSRGLVTGGQEIIITVEDLDFNDVPEYAQSGLVAHYDGIRNTRSGYASDSTAWEDLSGNGNDVFLVGTSGVSDWQQNGFLFTNNKFFAAPYPTLTGIPFGGGPNTHEVSYHVVTTDGNAAALLNYGDSSGFNQQGIIIDDLLGEAYYFTGSSINFYWASPGGRTAGTKRSLTTKWDGFTVYGYNDGVLEDEADFDSRDTLPGSLYLGIYSDLSSSYAATDIIMRSARIYDRALSDVEIACNAGIDRVRFDGSGVEDFSNCERTVGGYD